MFSKAARRRISFILLALFIVASTFSIFACSKPTAPACTDCGSGNIYWDTGANRCRDNSNGQFVKSCCCGH